MSSEWYDPERVVFVRSTGGGVSVERFHLDRECPRLAGADRVLEKRVGVLGDDVEVCRECLLDGAGPDNPYRTDAYERLEELSPAELGLGVE